jgi:LuxR family transcriptional regulator, maltose regulon positive regulatory protein
MDMVHFPYKILVPQRPPYLVPRPRLTDLLKTIAERRLITLSAPAGYGKTSLLTDFASTCAPLPVCWYSLDRFDEDPWIFLTYVAASIAQQFPGATERTEALLVARSRNPFTTAAAALVRDIYDIGAHFVLVIDDWHLVDHLAEVTELIALLLLHCPNCHLVLASRIYPSLPDMMLLAARRQMSGLDEEHLRFTADEISAVVDAEFHVPLQPDQARQLAEQSNGWIAGIMLALQATGPGVTPFAHGDPRAERQIYGFLAEQVFDRQPPEIRAFLLETALLEELTWETCDRVFRRTDSSMVLEMLMRLHLFVTEIRPGVLRYHPLFREFLQEHFRASDLPRYRSVALRVADDYAARRQWAIAFDTCVAAGDLEAAQRIAAAGGDEFYTSGRLETIERWFAVLPLAKLDAPLLCLQARVLLDRGRAHEAQALADLAEARVTPGHEVQVLLLQAQIARLAGDYEHALVITERALGIASEAAHRATALRTFAICHHRLGRSEQAIEALKQALRLERQRGDLYLVALLQQDLGVCYEDAGHLEQAAEYYSRADAHWALIGNTGMRAVSLNGKGAVQQLQGHYPEAHETLLAALQYARDASVASYQATALVSLGDLYRDLELWEQADGAYLEARSLGGSAFVQSYLDLAGVQLLCRQRRYEAAQVALEQLPEVTTSRHELEVRLLTAAIACGLHDNRRAEAELTAVLRGLEQVSKPMLEARAWLLKAYAASTNPAPRPMLCALERAASIAEQLGHDAFLVAEMLPFGDLLRRAAMADWRPAETYRQRHQTIRLLAQRLHGNGERPALIVRALGREEILLDGKPIDIRWQKARDLFFYLLAHPGGATFDRLQDEIWPELSFEKSRNALKSAIYELRSQVPRELIALKDRRSYVIDRQVVDLGYDAEEFMRLTETETTDVEDLFRALDLYVGQYLPLNDSTWIEEPREHLAQRYRSTLRTTARACERTLIHFDALLLYKRLLELDPLDEAAHAGVMRCQIALGNRAAAINQYQALRHILDEELGLEPGRASEVEQLYVGILATS